MQAAFAARAGEMADAAAIMPEGVGISRMLESFPIGKVGMFGMDVDLTMIDALLASANAGVAPASDPEV